MESISRADKAAFAAGGTAAHANALVEQSGIRVDPARMRGRSAGINPSGRYEPQKREVFDDGWESLEELPALKTEVQVEKPKTSYATGMMGIVNTLNNPLASKG